VLALICPASPTNSITSFDCGVTASWAIFSISWQKSSPALKNPSATSLTKAASSLVLNPPRQNRLCRDRTETSHFSPLWRTPRILGRGESAFFFRGDESKREMKPGVEAQLSRAGAFGGVVKPIFLDRLNSLHAGCGRFVTLVLSGNASGVSAFDSFPSSGRVSSTASFASFILNSISSTVRFECLIACSFSRAVVFANTAFSRVSGPKQSLRPL